MVEFLVQIETEAWVTADDAHRAMDMVENGEVKLNPVVLIRCPSVGVARIGDMRKLQFLPDDPA